MAIGTGETGWQISEVAVAGRYRFGIAYGDDATPDTDPVAYSYRVGSLEHLATLNDLALAVLKPGRRVLDLGAHLGGFSLLAAAVGCEVLAVEASARNADLLRKSAAHGRFRNLDIVQAAVSDRRGTLQFTSDGPYGHVSMAADADDADLTAESFTTVPAVTVDDLLAERKWSVVDFVKLDVEGSEVRAVAGMSRLLARPNGPLVFFESNVHTLGFYDETHRRLKTAFQRHGYQVYAVKPGRLEPWHDGDEQDETVMDFLAARTLPRELQAWLPPRPPSLFARVRRRLSRLAGRQANGAP